MIERPAAAVATTTTTAAAAAARGRRNRRPGPILPRRMVSAAVRARRVLGDHARIGLGNLRDALTEAPQIDLLLPPRPPENEPAKPRSRRVMVLPASEPVQPQRDLGDRELDAMGAGRLAMADSPASSRHRISARARRPRPRPHGANGAAGGAA
jgi:hypothetical protein